MSGLLVFAAIVIALLVVLGWPYPQSWASRWGTGR